MINSIIDPIILLFLIIKCCKDTFYGLKVKCFLFLNNFCVGFEAKSNRSLCIEKLNITFSYCCL